MDTVNAAQVSPNEDLRTSFQGDIGLSHLRLISQFLYGLTDGLFSYEISLMSFS
jgi:hypothetical protein